MPTYIRPDTTNGIYSYRFKIDGRKFSGSTGKTNKREADRYEQERRDEAKALITADAALFGKELTLEQAAARWWNEKGQDLANAERSKKPLAWLLKHFGPNIMLHDITSSRIAHMVAQRRGEVDARCRHKNAQRVGAATVNRTAVVPLRQIIVRARDVWEVKVAKVKWKDHLQKEPKERVREATEQEETAIMAKLDRGYDVAIEFAFLSGLRRMEIVSLRHTDVSFFGGGEIKVFGKGGREDVIPMSEAMRAILWAERDNHPEFVFTFVSLYTRRSKDGVRYVKGQRYPLTYEGFGSAMKRATANAGVVDFRMHDTRHTAATRMARATNLKVVQYVLRHSDIRTTMRYVHVDKTDMRKALEAIKCTKKCTDNADEAVKV